MKKYIISGVCVIAVILTAYFFISGQGYRYKRRVFENTPEWTKEGAPLIAHACGGLWEEKEDGSKKLLDYTNSREALINSLENGYRLIEADFKITTDGDFACTHYWPDEQEDPVSTEEWLNFKIEGKYTSMMMEDVLEILMDYPDVYLVTDLKSDHSKEEVQQEFSLLYDQVMKVTGGELLDRIIPQIYNREMYDWVKEIYPWPSLIYTLYKQDDVPNEEIIAFVREREDIPVVTMPKRRLDEGFIEELHGVGKYVYSHTWNSLKKIQELMEMGVDGFYTDSATPQKFQEKFGKS
ncbi:MAG: phosphatidylinositol-specific phospholipase C/glycerophosphodiester phosphodiesterase family protein [Eubacteriales bacterium]|nr:phosphatidylinositol-specific phospholipase C/glycerophosphodiester phosphodiesterase family protein [Eubacteriales bacterium]